MTEELVRRVWSNPQLHEQRSALVSAWLRRELDLGEGSHVDERIIVQSAQAAAILANSEDPAHLRAAFSMATCAADLARSTLPGLDGVLRLILTRMGNFPALSTSKAVRGFERLPMLVALEEERRRLGNSVTVGGRTVELTDFQRALWDVLCAGDNVAISAPTSAGKSFALQAYLRLKAAEEEFTAAVYLVPSRALIAQVGETITRWLAEDKIKGLSLVSIPIRADATLPSKGIYVVTQERMQAILTAHPGFAADVIVCDEAQSVQDGARGVLLQNVIDQLLGRRPSAQMVLAGPNIGNLQAFRSMFNLKLLREVGSRAPSVIQNLVLVNTRSLETGKVALSRFDERQLQPIGDDDLKRPLPTTMERLVRVAERFGKNKPSIVYANGPADAEKIAKGLRDVSGVVDFDERLEDLISLVGKAIHENYALGTCLRAGVGFHYGRIPALVRRGVEEAFSDGRIRYLVTTSTLIQGVNFPAANLFVCKPKKGNIDDLDAGEFWNLAGRAGRLGREFQGNIFLIDYEEWSVPYIERSSEIDIGSSIGRALNDRLDDLVTCARQEHPPLETDSLLAVEATFARLLSDRMTGTLEGTLDRFGVTGVNRAVLTAALDEARDRIDLPLAILRASPTVSALRQQRLFAYLKSEIRGGGARRMAELVPRHPRDGDAWKRLAEIFKICHRQLLSLDVPKLHLRMAAIAVCWMNGDPIPKIVDENHRRSGGSDIASSIRGTLDDIEQKIRFRYLRLTSCYLSILAHVLKEDGYAVVADRMPDLGAFLEVGAADKTMISLMSTGISRVTARVLTDESIDKEMDTASALDWLRSQNLGLLLSSTLMREEAERALRNAG